MRRLAIVAVLACGGCGDGLPELDGALPSDGGSADLTAPDGAGGLAGAFTIVGCALLDQSQVTPTCTASAPAQLTFVPLAAGVTDFVWSFAGGSPSTSTLITPVVSYLQPSGATPFTVMLAAGGPAGTTVSTGQILITAGAAGDPCGKDSDCDLAGGLACVCGAGEHCPGGLSVGICTRRCAPQSCAAGESCADLRRGLPAAPPDGGTTDGGAGSEPWRSTLCLRTCTSNADCRVGLACRELPSLGLGLGAASGDPFTWQKACFADVLGDIGASCASASGVPQADRCLSGSCAPIGARDLCTSDCASTPCPSYAGCAAFNAAPASRQCLPRCDALHPCRDPLLACQAAGGAGDFAFSILSAEPPGTMHCAPRRCTSLSDCAPAGMCTAAGAASFCTRAP